MNGLAAIQRARIRITRLSEYAVEKRSTSASVPIGAQPPQASRLLVTLDGTTITTGTVTVAGSTNEVLSFTQNGFAASTRSFTGLSLITLAGISNGFISVKTISPSGQPICHEKEIHATLPVYFFATSGKIKMSPPGNAKDVKAEIIAGPYSDIKEKDFIYAVSGIDGFTHGVVSFVDGIRNFEGVTQTLQVEVQDA